MANFSTYSFTDIELVLSHPSYGQFSLNGEGAGSIQINKTTERSTHNVAADGSVMTSKIAGDNGTVVVNAQQTSDLHSWIQGLFNYLKSANTNEWAQISMTMRAPHMGRNVIGTYGSIQKEPDETFETQGGLLAWTLLFADVQKTNRSI